MMGVTNHIYGSDRKITLNYNHSALSYTYQSHCCRAYLNYYTYYCHGKSLKHYM